MLSEYLWCVVVGGIFCFTLGFGMGANDVANNFGTSVGSKSITLKNALIIAAIFELVGSVALGANVTDSVRKGVYDPKAFGDMPDLLLMANMCALISGTLWLITATQLAMPISSTHALIGSLIGCGLAISWKAVNWGFVWKIGISWIVAPCVSAVGGFITFNLLRCTLLRKPDSVDIAMKFLWILIFAICSTSCVFFMLSNPLVLNGVECRQKTSEGLVHIAKPCFVNKWVNANYWLAIGMGLAGGAVLTLVMSPFIYLRVYSNLKQFDAEKDIEQDYDPPTAAEPPSSRNSVEIRCRGRMPWNADLHAEAFGSNPRAERLALHAEKFDPRCETFFKSLQVISAAVACLVHGSNDVSNASAPYASVYSIYREGHFSKQISVPLWILFLAGSAISVGLAVYGSKVITTVGIEMIFVSPSRGFCAEMTASIVLILASISGLPLSTTHVIVGAMIGIGLADRPRDPTTGDYLSRRCFGLFSTSSVEWKLVIKIMVAWVGTVIVCSFVGFATFAFSIFSPTRVYSRFTPCSQWAGDNCLLVPDSVRQL